MLGELSVESFAFDVGVDDAGQHLHPVGVFLVKLTKHALELRKHDYRLPEHLGGGQITVRLHQDEDDRRRKFNRTENVRPIPPSDPDFPRLYGRRNDSESLNRSLEDTLFLGRAHSLGWRRQQVEMLGWALMVNALTMARHRTAEDLEAAA